MAFSNTYNTTNPGSAVGNRESLLNELTVLAPEETPVLSMAPKGKTKANYHEWVVDSLSAPITTGVLEGSDVSAFDDKFANRAKLGNRVQHFRRTWKVSKEQEAVESVGPAGVAAAETKAQQELKRDVEAALVSDNDQTVGSASVAATLRGFGDWLDSAGPSDVPSDYRTPAASIDANGTSITEDQLNALIDSLYNENGSINRVTGVFATALRRAVSAFTRADTSSNDSTYTVTQAADSKKITYAVSLYESDHGVISFVTGNPVCMPATDRGYLINNAFYGVDTLIPMGQERLEDQGGGQRGFCDAFLTLRVKSPLAHAKIT